MYKLWCGIMFPYGFYRQWNAKQIDSLDLYSHRVLFSLGNGVTYVSPFGLCKIFNLVNRIDIMYNKHDMTKYKKSYEELNGYNHNVF